MKIDFHKKVWLFLTSVSLFSISGLTYAQTSPLVPCQGADCQLCHLFEMFNRVVSFILFTIVPPIAVLSLVIGGLLFYFSVGNPKTIETAKSLIKSTILGILIVYFAWSIVVLVFTAVGAAQWNDWWYTISC